MDDERLASDRDKASAQAERLGTWFDDHAQEWLDLYQHPQRVNDLVLADRNDAAVAFLSNRLSPGSRVLDVGCGAGWTALDLARRGFFVHGVDLSRNMIEHCEANFARNGVARRSYMFTQGDLLHIRLPASSFDGIVALGFLQYQVEEHRSLDLFHKLLKTGGILVVSGPIKTQIANYFGFLAWMGAWLRRMRILGPKEAGSQIAQHRYGLGRFRALLQRAGFDVIDYKGHGFGDFAIIGGWMGFKGELVLHRFFTWLSALVPIGRWGNDLIVVARKNT